MRHSVLGREIYATGSNPEAAHLKGILDVNTTPSREREATEKHLINFFKFLEKGSMFVKLFQLILRDCSKLYLGAAWTLEAAACVSDMEAWADGFPASKEHLQRFPTPIRSWMRNPLNKKSLIAASSSKSQPPSVAVIFFAAAF